MNPYLMILLIGLFYIVLFGGLSLLRREGLSLQFAFEVLGVTALVEAFAILTGIPINPLIFIIIIYLISMRVRLIVDLANVLSNRGRQRDAINLLQFALRLYPDHSARLVVYVNMGIVQLRRQNPESARDLFDQALEESQQGGLGIKYEAACRYNLALALQHLGKEAEAVRQFNETIVIFPNSIYGRAAERALEKHRHRHRGESQE
ncbi:MAG: tetratricopeptide repeat protein [Chloroflexota bacterium]